MLDNKYMIKLIYGEDIYVIQKKTKSLSIEFLKTIDPLNFVKYDFLDLPFDELLVEINTLPLGVEKKVVILDNVLFLNKKNKDINESQITELINFISNNNEDILLVLIVRESKIDDGNIIVKTIKNNGAIVVANYIKDQDWPIAARNFFNKRNIKITPEAINELIYRCQGNTLLFFNEAEKLSIYKDNITKDDVVELVIRPFEQENFALSNALLNSSKDEILRIYRDYITLNIEPIVIIAQLASSFRTYINVFTLASIGKNNVEIATELNIHPYRVKLAMDLRSRTTLEKMHQTSEQLYELDLNIKSGKVDRHLAFELFLLNY